MLEMLQIIGCPRLVSLKLVLDLQNDNKMPLNVFYLDKTSESNFRIMLYIGCTYESKCFKDF